jgi:hypothetical protein
MADENRSGSGGSADPKLERLEKQLHDVSERVRRLEEKVAVMERTHPSSRG